MWKMWQQHAPVRSPSDEGGAGGAPAGDAAPAAGEGGEDGEGQPAAKPAGSSILDFAAKPAGGDSGESGEWKLPDGLDLPEHLRGATADETLAKVAKAYQGARRELSTKGKGGAGQFEGAVPENPDGYTFEATGDDDKIAAELNSEASKPYVDAFRKAAHKLGIPDKTFATLMREGMAGIAETGVPLGLSDEEAAGVSGEAEMAALVKEVGQREAQTIVNTISTYGEKLVAKGILQNEREISEFAQMVGTADGARIFHRLLVAELGEKPIPPADGADASVTPQEAYAKHSAALRMPAGAERDQALAEANRVMQKAFGNAPSPSGSLRSSVL